MPKVADTKVDDEGDSATKEETVEEVGKAKPTKKKTNAKPAKFVFDPAVLKQQTPDFLIPKMDQYPVSNPVYFKEMVIHDPSFVVVGGNELVAPIDPFTPDDERTIPEQPVEGVLLTYQQAWREKGLALGRLLHSVCLAPGEVTKVAVIDFHRRTAGQNSESSEQRDTAASDTLQNSAVVATQNATANELQSGSSSYLSLANQSQASISGGGLFVSGTASTASNVGIGTAHSSSAASSSLASEGAKRVHQVTNAVSQSVRAHRAVQVREVDESESQTLTSRVLANYNHMHALTMMYFEVVQIFELETKVVEAQRVVYIPMKPLEFDFHDIINHSDLICAVLKDIGSEKQCDQIEAFVNKFVTKNILDMENKVHKARMRFSANIEKFLKSDAPNKDSAIRDGDLFLDLSLPNIVDGRKLMDAVIIYYNSTLAKIQEDEKEGKNVSSRNSAIFQYGFYVTDMKQGYFGLEKYLPDWKVIEDTWVNSVEYLNFTKAMAFLGSIKELLNHLIWMRLPPARYQRLVAEKTFRGTPLGHLMDPRPLGVFGNFVAFRLPHSTATGDADYAKDFTSAKDSAPSSIVAIPSGGVFGEAVLGEAISAEKIDLTRFWNWKDSPIPILPPEMQPINTGSRARGMKFTKVDMDETLTKLLETELAGVENMDTIISKVKEGVRDMSGGGELGTMMGAQIGAVQAGATAVGEQSMQVLKNNQDAALQFMKNNQEFATSMVNSDLGKAAIAAFAPEAEGATFIGGILGGAKEVVEEE